MKKIFYCFSVLLALGPALAGAQTWTAGAGIPERVRAANTAASSKNGDGWLWVVSGRNQGEAITKKTQRYQLSTDTWTEMAQHPTGLLGAATAVLNDSLYIVGGVVNPPGGGSNKVYKFSIDENAWSLAANLPYSLVDAKAVAYQDSLLYVAGGIGGSNAGNVLLYNCKTNKWRAATPFLASGSRSFGGFAVKGDTLVYMCGTDGFLSPFYFDKVYVGVIDQNNRAVIQWSVGAPFPGATRTFFDAHTWHDGIIMTGGSTDNTFNTASNECYVYSPGSNTWTEMPHKSVAWLTGQSGSVALANNEWKLICASGYAGGYLPQTEIFTDAPASSATGDPDEMAIGLHNFPNPFSEKTTIRYCLRDESRVTLNLHDSLGRLVRVLVNEKQPAGDHSVSFDGTGLASGVYYCTLQKEGISQEMIQCVLIR